MFAIGGVFAGPQVVIIHGMLGGGPAVEIPPITTTNICFTDEYLSVSRMIDESLACTRMIDESLEVCASHPPALAMTLAETRWFFNATSGDDLNDGSTDAPWQTIAKLIELIDDGFFTNEGEWVKEYYEDAGLGTVTTDALGITWYEEFTVGRRRLIDGDVIVFQTNMTFPIGGEQLDLSGLTGFTLRGANAGIRIGNQPDISAVTWTQPNVGLYPNVWKYTSASLDNACLLDNDTFVPVLLDAGEPFATEAAALTALTATANRSWHSATGFYLHPLGSTNPNTDGRTRLVTAEQSGAHDGMIHGKDLLIENLILDAGPLGDTSAPVIQSALSIETGGIVALKNVTIDGGSRWGISRLGTGLTGMLVMHETTFRGLFVHGYLGGQTTTHINDEPTNTSATGSLRILGNPAYHADGAWHNNGGTVTSTVPTNYNQLSYFAQNSGAFAIFKQLYFVDAYLGKIDVISYDRLHLLSGNYYSVFGRPLDGLVEECWIRSALLNIELDGVWEFLNCIIVAAANQVAAGTLSGEVTFNRCTFDLTLFPYATVNAMLAKQTDGCSAIFNDCAVIRNVAENNASLVSGMDDDLDTLDINNLALQGLSTTRVLHQHTNGAIANYTYAQAVAAGYITEPDSLVSADLLLNAASNYAVGVGSPVIGRATSGVDVADWTGTVFATRNDIGAREYVA